MNVSCGYFQSGRWEATVIESITRTWDAVDLLERYEEVDDPEHVLEQLRTESNTETDALGVEALVDQGTDLIDLDLGDVVELWYADKGDEPPEICPHDVYEDTSYCVFHLPTDERETYGVTDQDVKDAFLEHVRNSKDRKQFVGATFGELDLKNELLEATNNVPIDLRFAEIKGRLTLNKAEISQDILLHGAALSEVSFKNAECSGNVGFHNATFDERADFSYVEFDKKVEFWDARFEKGVTFYATEFEDYAEFRGTVFGGNSDFSYVNFGRDGEFWDARFGHHTTFHAAEFEGYAEFRRTVFQGDADFKYVHFGRDAEFWEANFDSGATFYASKFDGYAEFKDATLYGDSTFRYAEFHRDAEFWYTKFGGQVDCRNLLFRANAEFDRTTFANGADFRDTEFKNVLFVETEADHGQVDLEGASLHAGRIILPEKNSTFYNLKGATLGQVDLESDNDDYHLFEFFRFYDTQFDGFDFPRHREALNPTWEIHQFGGEIKHPDTVAELESTYLKAKNGASQAGDSEAAAAFFLKEMKYRRRGYWEAIRYGDITSLQRLFTLGKWGSSWFYNLTCGYGERPLRTIFFSLGLIVLFAFGYQLLGIQAAASGFLSYLTFSFQTFVALILGDVPQMDTILPRLLAAFEAFLGAFFIALFVFALARSIRR